MKKNENIDILVDKIINNEELVRKFAELDFLDEIYDFCKSIQGGYTREEFALFIDETIDMFAKDYSKDATLAKSMNDGDLANVSGGAKSNVKRILAASLASLSFITAVPPKFNHTYASEPRNMENVAADMPQQENEQDQGGVWNGLKAKLSSLKDMIIRNKGKVTIGALIIAAIGLLVYGKKNWWNGAPNLEQIGANDQNLVNHLRSNIEGYNRKLGALLIFDDQTQFNQYIRTHTVAEVNRFNRTIENLTANYVGANNQQGRSVSQAISDITASRNSNIERLRQLGGDHWYSSMPALAQIIAGGGAVVTGAKTIWDLMYKGLGGVGSISKAVSDFNNARYSVNSITQDILYQKELRAEQNNKKEFDRKEALERLEEGLATVRGQEKAKKGVRGFFNSVTMERERLKAIGEIDSHAHVAVFNGASGTGKSFTAGHLASAISNASPYVMSASEVDVNSSKSSIVGQLFGDNGGGYGYGYGYGGGQQEKKNFVKYIQDHPNDGVVIINEYDKMCVKDSKDHPLDEVMRTFIDEGKATINGTTIDCSGVVFILTTNESDGSLQGKVYVDPATKQLIDPSADDSTGSRTIVKHDKSFLNRLTIISFDNLSATEYNQITRDHFAPTIEFLRTDEGGNIDLFISDESYDKVAKYVERVNEGARTIDKVLGLLFNAVVEKVSTIMKDDGEYIGKRFEALYDDETNEFKLEEIVQ